MIITATTKDVFRLPFSLKKEQENQELLSDYNGSVAVNNSQDTVHFSETSLTKLQESSSGDKEQQDSGTSFLYNKDGKRVHTEALVADVPLANKNVKADDQSIESLKKQIKEIEKKIAKTQIKLSEAEAQAQDEKSATELMSTATNEFIPPASAQQPVDKATQLGPEEGNDGANDKEAQHPKVTAADGETNLAEADSPEASPVNTSDMDAATKAMINAAIAQAEVDMISSELKSLNAQLLGLNNSLADAIRGKTKGSNGPPGAAGGTRAGG